MASRSADEEVVIAVAVGIAPGQTAAELREFAGKQWLAGVVVVRLLGVFEGQADTLRDLGEEGFRLAWLGRPGYLAAAWFSDRVAAVGCEIVEGLHLPAWPTNAESVDHVRLAKAEVHRVVVAREEPGHRVGLANLFPRLALDLDDRAQSVAVAPGASQSDDDAMPLVAKVAVNTCRFVDVGHDEIEVAVAVKVAVGGRVAHTLVIKAPRLGSLLKL